MPAILLVEDDPAIAAAAGFALEREGFAVTHVLLLQDAQRRLHASVPDALVLDIGLPDGSGLELCRALRQEADPALARLPVLLLTARDEEIDRVLGLELGADDYMGKPFSPRELVARLRALLRRAGTAGSPAQAATCAAAFDVDEPGQRIRYAGRVLELTRLEYGLLRKLLANPSRIHSRAALLDAVWTNASEAGDRTVDTHIKTLRAKLRECTPQFDPIVTHRGLGYSLVLQAPSGPR